MKTKRVTTILAATAISLSVMTGAASAAVVTTGCVSSDTCTLAELQAGGSFLIDDVVIDNFLNIEDDGDTPLDFSQVSIMASSTGMSTILRFIIDPTFTATQLGNLVDLQFDYSANILASSSREFTSGALSFLPGDVSITGLAGPTIRTGFDGILTGPEVLFIEDSDLLNIPFDSLDLSGLTMLDLITEIDAGVFGASSSIAFSGFQLELFLDSAFIDPAATVPVPAALPLMLCGLFGLGFASRNRKNAKA